VADNTIQGGTDTIATDDIGGIKYQRVKPAVGADGVAVDVSASAPMPVYRAEEAAATFRGRAATYRMPGRAGTAARRLLALWNAVGSGKVVHINQIAIDTISTAAYAVTVIPPVIRVHRITAIPTNGTALTKNAKDTNGTSNVNISLFGDASADGTNSTTALAATTTAGAHLFQEYMPRLITAAGYEMFDKAEVLDGKDVIVRAGEGIVLSYDNITLATQEPATQHTVATIDWFEV
jgi:hypothetical protein